MTADPYPQDVIDAVTFAVEQAMDNRALVHMEDCYAPAIAAITAYEEYAAVAQAGERDD